MPNYNTTADDFAGSGGDGSLWENVDGTTLLKEGWQPGKKHSLWQNIKRVASFGGYNPDDRDASAINKKILGQHGMNQESFAQVRQAHQEEIEKRTNDIMSWDPNIPRSEARRIAIEMFTTEYFADLAANKADKVQSDVRGAEMEGRLPGSKEFGASAVEADTKQNRARGAQMDLAGRGAAAQGKLMVPELQAGITSREATARSMGADDAISNITEQRLKKIKLGPLQDRREAADASREATTAEARAGLWNSPFSKTLAQHELNKQLGTTIAPWNINSMPYPGLVDNAVEGKEKPPGTGGVGGYTTEEVIRRDELGNVIGTTRTRTPTTADPAAPPMTPAVPPKQGIKMTPEQFRALFNPQ